MMSQSVRNVMAAIAVAALSACSTERVSAPDVVPNATLVPIAAPPDQHQPVPGAVKVCSFNNTAFTTSFTTATAAGLPSQLEAVTPALTNGECSVTWLRNGFAGSVNVTVTQTGPAGFQLSNLAVIYTAGAGDGFAAADVCGQPPVNLSPTVNVTLPNASAGVVIYFKQCQVQTPPPPPPSCNGLTPGFWKNYDNHFTEQQFAILLDGTSSANLTNAAAKTVLGGNNPALTRLKKFLLANELTISLTNSLYNTPMRGSLAGTCVLNGDSLANAIALAKAIIANPGAYTNQQILDAGTVLDNFANL